MYHRKDGHNMAQRVLSVEYRPLASLRFDPQNPRLHSKKRIRQIAILDSTARGGVVLDAFLGSGTTVIAAERTGRACYGIELEPRYVDTIVRRWQAFTGQTAVQESTGRTFNEIEEENNGRAE
jgi:16S rRNA G966 N2-methylase RsmD